MPTLETILLVDDRPRETEMELHAMEGGNEAVALRDGAEMLGHVFRCGSSAGRARNQPVGISVDLKMSGSDGLKASRQMECVPALRQTSACRAVLNEPSLAGSCRQGKA